MADRSVSVRMVAEVDAYRRDMQSAAAATGSIGEAAAQASQQRSGIERLGSAGRAVGQTLATAAGVAAAGVAAIGAAALSSGASYSVLEQQSRAALSTLLGSTEAAEAQMDDLREFVESRLFPREVFIDAQQQMLAFGFAAEQVIPTLGVLEDAVAATGGTAQTFTEVVRILSRVQSTGQVTAESLNELARRGINAAELIGQAMGQTEASIRDSITQGTLDGREAIEVLVTQMETRFEGGAEALTQTWIGASGLVAAGLRNIGSAATEAFVDPSGGGAAIQWANDVAEVLYAVHRQLEPLVAELRERAEPSIESVSARLQELAERIDQLNFTQAFDQLRDAAPIFGTLAAGIGAAGSAALLSGVPGLGALTGAINPFVAAAAAAAASSPELRQALLDLLEAASPLISIAVDLAAAFSPVMTTALDTLATILRPVVTLVDVLASAFDALPGPVQTATVALAAMALLAPQLRAFGNRLATLPAQAIGASVALQRAATGFGGVRTALGGLLGILGGPWGLAIAGGVTALSVFAGAGRDARAEVDSLSDSLWDNTGALQENAREILANRLEQSGLIENYSEWGELLALSNIQLPNLTDVVLGNADAQREWDAAIAAGRSELSDNALPAFQEFINEVESEATTVDESRTSHERQRDEVEEGADAQRDAAEATDQATVALQEQLEEIRARADPMFALHRSLRDLEEAQANYNEVLEDAESTEADVTDASIALAEAALEVQGAVGEAAGTFDGELDPAFRATLESAGLTEEQIDRVEGSFRDAAESGDEFAKDYNARVDVEGLGSALDRAMALERELGNLDGTRSTVHVDVTGAGGVVVPDFHTGGRVPGRRGGEVLANLAAEEHVWTPQEVQAAGGHAAVEAMRATVLAGESRFAAPAVGGGSAAMQVAAGGELTGNLYLDSGEFLGVVRGQVRSGISAANRDLVRRTQAGAGAAA